MAVAGGAVPALHIARVNGRYCVIHAEGRPADILCTVAEAKTQLLSGQSAWIKSSERALLAAELKADIRSIQTRG